MATYAYLCGCEMMRDDPVLSLATRAAYERWWAGLSDADRQLMTVRR